MPGTNLKPLDSSLQINLKNALVLPDKLVTTVFSW